MPAGEWMEPFTASLVGMNGWVIVLLGSLVNLVPNKVGAAAVDILFIASVFSVNTVCKGISSFCQLISVSWWFWKESILYEEILVKADVCYVHLFIFSFQQSRLLNASGCVCRLQVLQFFLFLLRFNSLYSHKWLLHCLWTYTKLLLQFLPAFRDVFPNCYLFLQYTSSNKLTKRSGLFSYREML